VERPQNPCLCEECECSRNVVTSGRLGF
jgi:hypothetical protein